MLTAEKKAGKGRGKGKEKTACVLYLYLYLYLPFLAALSACSSVRWVRPLNGGLLARVL